MSSPAPARRLYGLSPEQFATVERLCEFVVPGSGPAGPAVYLDSVAADLDEAPREALLGCIDDLTAALAAGARWADLTAKGYFGWLRALAIEAYYSDFRQPGYTGPGAWAAIEFTSAPMAARAKQDWSYLRCYRWAAMSS